MTAASHGFPDDETNVYHPNSNGQVIGNVVRRLPDTDIALVKLRDNIKFENHTFQSDDEPDGILLKGFKDPFKMGRLETLSMENSFVGLTDAMFLTVAMNHLPSSDNTKHMWVEHLWAWYGQEKDKIPVEGCCGSAIYDKDGYVVTFFRHLSPYGIGYGIAAEELLRMGYSLNTSIED